MSSLVQSLGVVCKLMIFLLVAGLAASKGMELHDLVLGTPGLLEWLGQHFTTSSAIIGAPNSSAIQFCS
jgi:hypothetical protein